MLVESKKTVYPQDVRHILWQLHKLRVASGGDNKEVIPLLAAESISLGARDLLRQENVGYYDTGGSLFVPAQGAYIYVEKPPPKSLTKSIRTLFRGKRSQVLHALLLHHDRWFGVKELAQLAIVSAATTSETLTALERYEWIDIRGQGPSKERRIAKPGPLLDEWQRQMIVSGRSLEYRRYYVPVATSEPLEHRLAGLCDANNVEYVLTEEAAAQRYAPYLTAVSSLSCRIAAGRAGHKVIEELGARVVAQGPNLRVIETKTHGEFLFKRRMDSVWLASPVQVYLDLLRGTGRSKEMAEHLRLERLGF
jgi:hypothetical protein